MSLRAGMKVEATEPKAEVENNVYIWRVGAMMPRQEKNLQVKLNTETRGDVTPKAWVTFTGMLVLHIKVLEPKLIFEPTAQHKALMGEAAAFTLTATNPGDGSADQGKNHAQLSGSLSHGQRSEVNVD